MAVTGAGGGMVRRIAVLTSSRADYGLLRGVISALDDAEDLSLQLIVSGTHLAPQFGLTVKEIEADRFPIAARVDLELDDDSALAVARSAGLATMRFASAIQELLPEVLILLGDRYEILSAAVAATLFNVPIAHIHGGEITFGAFDDQVRHAITKLALVHFVAAEPYRRRVIQLGENPDLVFTVGAPGLDQLHSVETVARESICLELNIPMERGFLLATLHPTTAQPWLNDATCDAMLGALGEFPDRVVVFTGVNADPGSRAIDAAVHAFVRDNRERARLFPSLGTRRYLSALRHADAVIGNSSSGIIEAPAVGTPTVNIGDRQAGRLRAASVVDCEPSIKGVVAALKTVLAPEFHKRISGSEPPYGRGGASKRIVEILRSVDIASHMPKRFFDLSRHSR